MRGAEIILSTSTAIASLGLLVSGTRTLVMAGRVRLRLGHIGADKRVDASPSPLFISGLLALAGRLVSGSDRLEIARHLRAAGFAGPRAIAIFAALRLLAAVLAAAIAASALVIAGYWAGALRLLVIPAAGVTYVAAKLVLASLAARHTRRISEELPFALDLMTMMLESGISLDQCFRILAGPDGSAAPAISATLGLLAADTERGMAYDQALSRWAARLAVPGAHELAGLLRQSLSHGAEISATLREFAHEFTARRVAAARESIGRKTTAMAAVMMIFLMPALFIMLCGPAVVALAAALSGTRP